MKYRPIILIFLVLLGFFAPLLFFGKIFVNGDGIFNGYVNAYFFKTYGGALINEFKYSGYPVIAAFHFGFFHPVYNLFYRIFDYLFAYHLLLFLDFFGTALFTYLFARAIKISQHGSLLAAFGLVFSQFVVAWGQGVSMANAIFLLPALLYATLMIARGRPRFIVLFSLVLGLAFLGTHYQFIVLALLASGVLLLFEVRSLMPIGHYILALLLSAPIGWAQFIHSYHFFAASGRIDNFFIHAVPWLDLPRYLMPTYELPYMSLGEFRPYLGLVTLFFVIVALVAYRRQDLDPLTHRYARFFVWSFVVVFLLIMQFSPLPHLLAYVPVIKYFGEVARWLYLGNFALVLLAGIGFDYAVGNPALFESPRLRTFFKNVTLLFISAGALVTVAIVLWGDWAISLAERYFDSHLYATTAHLPLGYYHEIIGASAHVFFSNFSLLHAGPLIFVLTLVGLTGLVHIRSDRAKFSNAALALSVLGLLLVARLAVPLGDASMLTEPSRIAGFIHAREESEYDYRVYTSGIDAAQYEAINATHAHQEIASLEYRLEALANEINVFSGVPVLGGYDALVLGRYEKLMNYLADPTVATETKLPVLSMMNVKYVVSPVILPPPFELLMSQNVTSFKVPLHLYENPNVLPRSYLAQRIQFVNQGDTFESLAAVTHVLDFRTTTLMECDSCQSLFPEAPVDAAGRLELLTRDNAHLHFRVTSAQPTFLVVSYESVPGWRARVDGLPSEIYSANYVYQAVFVPAGTHLVSFEYHI